MTFKTQRLRKPGFAGVAAMLGIFVQDAFSAAGQNYKGQIEPILKNYCFECHGDGVSKGEVSFDTFTNLAEHVRDQKLWLAVWQNLQTQMMPPSRKPQPSDDERRHITKWIERDVFKLDPSNPDP